MPTPVFGSSGTHINGTSSTASFAVPASVAANDIIIVVMYTDVGTTISVFPAGFAHAENSPVTLPSGGGQHSLNVCWKRATGADTGTYDFTLSASVYRAGAAHRYTGCITSGSPWDTPTNTATDTANSTVTPAVSITTAGSGRMLIFGATDWAGGSWTPPTGFTERMDAGDGVHTMAEKAQNVAGSSGSVTATCTGSNKRTAWLGALIGTTTTVAIGTTAETDSTFSFGANQSRSVGLSTETDAAVAFGRGESKPLGTTTETDAAIALGLIVSKILGVVAETDQAFAFGNPAIGAGAGYITSATRRGYL